MKKKQFFAGLGLLGIGYVTGLLSYKADWFPVKQIKRYYYAETFDRRVLRTAGEGRDTVVCTPFNNDEYMVILTAGQSNATNTGQTKYRCRQEVCNWYDGKFYRAEDPLLGATSLNGSIWTRMADMLVGKQLARKVVIVPVGIGGVSIGQWAKGGRFHGHLMATIDKLRKNGVEIDMIVWCQGETDNIMNTGSAEYVQKFESIYAALRRKNVAAPMFVALTSYFPTVENLQYKQMGCDTAIRNAQQTIIGRYADVYRGADTDRIDRCRERHDGIHFSVIGLEKCAAMWVDAIRESGVFPEAEN